MIDNSLRNGVSGYLCYILTLKVFSQTLDLQTHVHTVAARRPSLSTHVSDIGFL